LSNINVLENIKQVENYVNSLDENTVNILPVLFIETKCHEMPDQEAILARLRGYDLEPAYWEELYLTALERICNCDRQGVVASILLAYCGKFIRSVAALTQASTFESYIRERICKKWRQYFQAFLINYGQPWFTFPVTSGDLAVIFAQECSPSDYGAFYYDGQSEVSLVEDVTPSQEVCRLEDLPNVQLLVATTSVLDTVKSVLEVFFSEGAPVSPLELKFIAESMSCHSVGYIEIAKFFSGIDSCAFWRANQKSFEELGYWCVGDQAARIASQISPPQLLTELSFSEDVRANSLMPALEELVMCLDTQLPYDVTPLICKKLFLAVTSTYIPRHYYAPGRDIGTYHFGSAPMNEIAGSLTIPRQGTTHLVHSSPYVTNTFVYVRVPYELVGMHWYASLFSPCTHYAGYNLFRALRPVVISNNRFTLTLRLDVSIIPKDGSLWISCFNDDLELCGGSSIALTRDYIDVSVCMLSTQPLELPSAKMNYNALFGVNSAFSTDGAGRVVLTNLKDCQGGEFLLTSIAHNVPPKGSCAVEATQGEVLTNKPVQYMQPFIVSGSYFRRSLWLGRRRGKLGRIGRHTKRVVDPFIPDSYFWVDSRFRSTLMKINPYIHGNGKGGSISYSDLLCHHDRWDFYHYCAVNRGKSDVSCPGSNGGCHCELCVEYFKCTGNDYSSSEEEEDKDGEDGMDVDQ